MWGQFLICHTCIAPTRWLHRGALPVDLGGVILSQLLGGCARSSFGSISDAKGWPRGMDLCANGLLWCRLAQDQLGCSAALAQMQRGLHWHAQGSHVPQGTQGTSTVVHSWCTHTLYSNLVGMATDTWADTPWSNPWGVLYPSRVTTPFLSYSFMNLWIGRLACLV